MKEQRASQKFSPPPKLLLFHFSGVNNAFEMSNDGLKSAKGERYLIRQGKTTMKENWDRRKDEKKTEEGESDWETSRTTRLGVTGQY